MFDNTEISHDHIRFLSVSPARIRLLSCLDEAPRCPCDLTSVLSLSRRGIQRNLSELVERGWAKKTEGEYHLTTRGTFITRQYSDFLTTLDIIDEYEPFFTHLPDYAHIPSPQWLHDAEIVTATADHPYAPLNEYVNCLHTHTGSIETVRSTLPVLSRFYTDLHRELSERGVDTEILLDQGITDVYRNENPESLENMLSLDTLTLYEHDENIDFGLTLTDRRGFMGAYDSHGQLRASIKCTNPEFLDWAMELYQRYRHASREIELTETVSVRDES
ncbi:helix-turn-helix transcriptional regulator [Halocatena marina]|uniref:helix-turn-helix transcriptional regulator n=1 Tax=Halocatena marina TaxID=2934937 RepID=UPI00200C9F2F|nr:transcriptional regulator FilR1 domain-containing protein [Halocatena marina]